MKKALEKQEVLKNLDYKNQDRKEYIDSLKKLINYILSIYKDF